MGQKWIIDVIDDLRVFAEQNGLPRLAAQLDSAATIAQAELAEMPEGAPRAVTGHASQPAPAFADPRSGHGT
ncbi:hypothetical protein DC363_04870 [Thalassorhabdomicrobium marinisediminis]|uniref:Uncharacterized protein n=1 Tax=Thalassorhabdomicrobium marinisediminis TaxID=2170577 RepID=A0A2T7FYH4_9RHOB|nr:hypothetical protein DC363_04870 [Thalassorhabdomicrobium marinisediminis]